jgi:hypothetical protein
MAYVCPTWQYASDAHVLNLQNRVFRAIGNSDRHTPVREMHMALNTLYVYGYITTLCRKPAEVIPNHLIQMYVPSGQEGATRRKHKRLNRSGD